MLTSTPSLQDMEQAKSATEKKRKSSILEKAKGEKGKAPKKRRLFAADRPSCSKRQDTTADECLYCHNVFSSDGQQWVQCQGCQKWAHEDCAGVDKHQDTYICEFCE